MLSERFDMIIHDKKTGKTTFFLSKDRKLEMSREEYLHFERLIKDPPPEIKLKNPPKPWSPCAGKGCSHSSHPQNKQKGQYEEYLSDLDDLTEGLSNWELTFMQSLHDWDGMWTGKQCETLEKIWDKHC